MCYNQISKNIFTSLTIVSHVIFVVDCWAASWPPPSCYTTSRGRIYYILPEDGTCQTPDAVSIGRRPMNYAACIEEGGHSSTISELGTLCVPRNCGNSGCAWTTVPKSGLKCAVRVEQCPSPESK